MSDQLNAESLHPSRENLRQATRKALGSVVPEAELDRFLDSFQGGKAADPITANASLKMLFVGRVTCNPTEPGYTQWTYDHKAYGPGGAAVEAAGFIYAAAKDWSAIFTEVTGFEANVGAETVGFLQINFLVGLLPVAQFNGFAGGAGIAVAGGDGAWALR